MEKLKIEIGQRPNYYRGQLLLEGDFLAEQTYHVDARRHHNRYLHDWGVVRGLTVSRDSDTSLTINPGVAIDVSGDEIFLERPQRVSLAEFGPNELLQVGLSYDHGTSSEGSAGASQNRCDVYAVITVSRIAEDGARLTIARVQLDGQGKLLDEKAIDYSHTRYVKMVAPGSITSTELPESLRKGWLRMPFRPIPLVNAPEGEREIPPEFRVGATQALSPDPEVADTTDRGAAGTMAIPIPPSVTQVTRMRIAGARNEGEILLQLVIGGWDLDKDEHFRKIIVDQKIASEDPPKPFIKTFDIDIKDTALDPEYQTLSLWLRGTRRTSISLIAVEFVYQEK
jgi:hypothetical protein